MSMHFKRWYSRRNQILLFTIVLFSSIHYNFLYKRPSVYKNVNLDLTQRQDKGQGCEIPTLDPFSKKVTQFDKKIKQVDCKGLDWVKCYLSECHVKEPILLTTSYIKCTYRDILYINDDNYVLGSPTTKDGAEKYKLVNSDHVKISCTGLRPVNYLTSKWTGLSLGFREVKPKDPPEGRENTYNVLMLGFDSTAKNGFIRRMPKSYTFLKDDLGATILNGYNVVGDGTTVNMFPVLTGKSIGEFPESRKSINGSKHLDVTKFIFYKLRDDGYRTAYFEDMPWIGTFQFRLKGFLKQPADHYLRDFLQEETKLHAWKWSNDSTKYCVGDTPQYKLLFNITEQAYVFQFFKIPGKKFCFTFVADICHDDINLISTSDQALTSFLRAFKEDGRLNNTLLIVMGDHGPGFANVRNTFQGKLEERLPLMAIVLPEQLRDKRPSAQIALKSNIDTLTTPHDIHATLLDVVGMKQHWNDYKVAGADLPRGMTLLEPIPRTRSCSDADISPHWCACVKWIILDSSHPIYTKAANALVEHMNNYTQFMRSRCAVRTLTSIEWVQRFKDKKPVTAVNQTYQVKIISAPGKGIYEATVLYLTKKKIFRIDTRDIQRTNAYGKEPSCVSSEFPRLNSFCYCYGYTTSKSNDKYKALRK